MIAININDIKTAERILCNDDNVGLIVVFKNGSGKFIRGEVFRNCISIGARTVLEYDTVEEAYFTTIPNKMEVK